MLELGVNIDHIATLRQARKGAQPDLIMAAKLCELAGAHQITVHLREDRRHIQDRDVELLKDVLQVRMNLEMAATAEMVLLAKRIKPYSVCLVPEKREEVTTEGGLNAIGQMKTLEPRIRQLQEAGIQVSLFVDPEEKQVEASAALMANAIEIHTGNYANAVGREARAQAYSFVWAAAITAAQCQIALHAGHGLTIENLPAIASIPTLTEVNIGHSIISRALFVGIEQAVEEILDICEAYSAGPDEEEDFLDEVAGGPPFTDSDDEDDDDEDDGTTPPPSWHKAGRRN